MPSFFNHQDKTTNSKQAVEKHQILGIASLISSNNRQKTIQQISNLLDLSCNNFDIYCSHLIRNLFEWMQTLPATESSYYSKDARFIDHILQRTLIVLRNCSSYFTLHKGNLGLFDNNKGAWLYMLFSAGMLQGIGQIATDLKVTVYDSKGDNPKIWSPFSSPLQIQGAYFSYSFDESTELNFKNRATLFLAQQLMPKKGLDWIIEDLNIFATWLALLDEDEQGGGAIAEILQLLLQLLKQANAESIRKNLEDAFFKHFSSLEQSPSAYNNLFGPASQIGEDIPLALQIIHFLNKGLLDGSIKVNQSPLLAVPGGLIILSDIAQLFARNNLYDTKNNQVSWQDIQNALIKHQFVTGSGNALKTFSNSQGKYTGLVIDSAKFPLPENFDIILPNSDTATRISQSQFFSLPVGQLTNLIEHGAIADNVNTNMQGVDLTK